MSNYFHDTERCQCAECNAWRADLPKWRAFFSPPPSTPPPPAPPEPVAPPLPQTDYSGARLHHLDVQQPAIQMSRPSAVTQNRVIAPWGGALPVPPQPEPDSRRADDVSSLLGMLWGPR